MSVIPWSPSPVATDRVRGWLSSPGRSSRGSRDSRGMARVWRSPGPGNGSPESGPLPQGMASGCPSAAQRMARGCRRYGRPDAGAPMLMISLPAPQSLCILAAQCSRLTHVPCDHVAIADPLQRLRKRLLQPAAAMSFPAGASSLQTNINLLPVPILPPRTPPS